MPEQHGNVPVGLCPSRENRPPQALANWAVPRLIGPSPSLLPSRATRGLFWGESEIHARSGLLYSVTGGGLAYSEVLTA